MISAKIITFEKAKEKGLTSDDQELPGAGENIIGAMCSAKKEKKPGTKEIFLEKYYVKKNGKKELVFLHEDRKKELREQNKLIEYFNQFDIIEGKEKAVFLNENELRLLGPK